VSAVEPLPDLCPRVVGGLGNRVKTCGHTLPCPYHGEPIVRVISPKETEQ
jgi:hypothetical protein